MTRQIFTGILGSKVKGHEGPYIVKIFYFCYIIRDVRPINFSLKHKRGKSIQSIKQYIW